MVTSTLIFGSCRMAYERELQLTKQVIAAQSKPVTAEQMLAAERAHVAKLTGGLDTSSSTEQPPAK